MGGAQPDCPSDGLVPGSGPGEGAGGAEGRPLIGFTVNQWTMEQVEADRGTMVRKRSVCSRTEHEWSRKEEQLI